MVFDRKRKYDGTDPELVKTFYAKYYAGKSKTYCAKHRQTLLPRLMREQDATGIERLRSEIRAIDMRLTELAQGAMDSGNAFTLRNDNDDDGG